MKIYDKMSEKHIYFNNGKITCKKEDDLWSCEIDAFYYKEGKRKRESLGKFRTIIFSLADELKITHDKVLVKYPFDEKRVCIIRDSTLDCGLSVEQKKFIR